MFRFPQRKTRLVVYFAIAGGVSLLGGCAEHAKPAPTPASAVKPFGEGSAPRSKPALTRSMAPGPEPVAKPTVDEWVYRKNGPAQSQLSLFEESILLGQVRATLKKCADGAKVATVKVRNRTAHLGVAADVDSASARRIGETLLEQTRLDEVRLKPAS